MMDGSIKDESTDQNHELFINSHSPTFLLHNGLFTSSEISDIEMINMQSATYTSLKDLLPAASTSRSLISPTHNSSWNEIPIKNPLVKQAALAYLQPMGSPPEVEKGFFGRLREWCSGECGCLTWFNDVLLTTIMDRLWSGRAEDDEQAA